MDNNLLGSTVSYFIVGKKGEEAAFPVRVSGFSAYQTGDIQSSTWFTDSATVIQMASLLTMFAQLNGDSTIFSGREQLVEYTVVDSED